ncbi:MAG: CRISPR-associated endonuclease Cas2 [Bacillota bacterium]
MQTLVIYDIPDDRLRARIAEACKDYGLARIQWSAFLGELSQNRREELAQRCHKTLGRHEGNVQLYPVCDRDMRLSIEVKTKPG